MRKPLPFGKYLLLERINVGGMAEVFIAKAFGVEGFERILAIKRILPTMAEDTEFISMFIDEARISVQLNHANIVHIHELGKYGDTYFIAMEYVAGRDLRAILEHHRQQKRAMPTAQAVYIASRMCDGLDHAHRKKDARGFDLGIIHRDVSPQNILVSFEGEVKLIDFGIAKAANRLQKTQAGILKGKFGYMSPEQVRGLDIDRRSDIFAVGVVLYEMLTGEKLFTGESDFSILERVRNAQVPSPRALNPTIPPGLEQVLLKALAADPAQRYQWASDLQEDLMRFLLTGDALYSAKHLAGFMQDAFREDLGREAERMERFAAVERPEQMEVSAVTSPGPRPRTPPAGTPVATAFAAPLPPAAVPVHVSEEETLEESDRTVLMDAVPGFDATVAGAPAPDFEATLPPLHTAEPAEIRAARGGAVRASGARPKFVVGVPGADAGGETVIGPTPAAPPRSEDLTAAHAPPAPVDEEEDEAAQQTRLLSPVQFAEQMGFEDPASPPEAEQAEEQTDPGISGWSGEEEQTAGRAERPAGLEVAEPGAHADRPTAGLTPARFTAAAPGARPAALQGRKLLLGAAAAAVVLLVALVGLWLRGGGPALRDVQLDIQPSQAQVTVDGRPVPAGGGLQLPPGAHELAASAEGFVPQARRFTVEEGEEPLALQLALVPVPVPAPPPAPPVPTEGAGEAPAAAQAPAAAAPEAPRTFVARFVGDVPGAEVTLEGRSLGRIPEARAEGLEAARTYHYAATLAGYRRSEGEFRSEGEDLQVRVTLEKLPPAPAPTPRPNVRPASARREVRATGRLACSSKPSGAEVYVDGKRTHRTTPVGLSSPLVLPVGEHTVVFKLDGRSSKPQRVIITEGEITKLPNVPIS